MTRENRHDSLPRVRADEESAPDPLDALVQSLIDSAGLPAAEVERRVREAVPAALADATDGCHRLREFTGQCETMVATAASELRSAADVLDEMTDAAGAREAARLRGIAEELDRSLRPPAVPALRHLGSAVLARPRVVVADDDHDARDALALVLESDFDVSTASDGEAAVELVRAEHPDIVLMDLYMPHVDGIEALQRLRSDPSTSEIPVIFVSGRGDDAVKARTLDLGAVDYLQKPFSDRELLARVDRTLRLARSHTALRELAQTDALTGLANLRAFRARLEDEVKRARRYRTPLTCIMADMDNLKPVNDELGHAAGDRAIAAVAAIIRSELRETDFGARYGGDEFVILLPHTTAEDGRVLAERICSRLKEASLQISGRHVHIGASFGVASTAGDAADDGADSLVRAADAALYDAKRAGRGCVATGEIVRPDAAARGA